MEESETTFRMKRSAASQLNKHFVQMLEKQFLTIADCYEIMSIVFEHDDIIRSWTELLRAKHQNYETFLNDTERMNFMADAVSEFSTFREHLDPTSRLLLGGASPSLPSEVTFWDMRFPNILIANLKKGGTYGCISGLPRSGKTSLAVNFMELFISDTQLHILTNIVIKEEMEQIHMCPTLSSLVQAMATNPGWICILDETATFVGKKRALSTENIDFENLGRFIGKLGGRLIMITHDMARDVPPILQSWMSEQFRKTDLTSMIAILNKPGGLRMNRIIANIPDCSLSFVTEDIASLNFDVSIKKLLSDIQTMKGVEKTEQKRAILDWLEKNKKSPAEEDQERETLMERAERCNKMVNALLKKGMSKMKAYAKVAKELGYTPETIRQYVGFVKRDEDESDGKSVEAADESGPVDSEEESEVSG